MLIRKKAIMLTLAAVMTISAAVFVSLPKVEAASQSITILIDGVTFHPPDALPFISSDRVMVPFRPIGEVLGCRADWDGTQQKVTMSLGNRYLDFVIGSTNMNLATTDVSGSVIRTNVTLDAPAMLVNNNRAFVPLRALSEGLGATVQWVAETRTVLITSNIPRPTPVGAPTQAVNSVFATTSYFEIVSGTRVQEMYNLNGREVIFYFDSSDSAAVNSMPAIMQAARAVNTTVFGIDTRTSPNMQNLNWVYSYIDRNSKGPALLFLYGRDRGAILLTSFGNQADVNSYFENWNRNQYSTPTPTGTPKPSGTVTPTPTPRGSQPDLRGRFRRTTKWDVMNMCDNRERFVLLYFDTGRSGLDRDRLDDAIEAVYESDKTVYYINEADERENYNWPGSDYFNDDIPNPCMFFIDYGEIDKTETKFKNIDSVADDIKRFLK